MTRSDPSTYYTPPRILALCEPQAGSGAFLVNPPWEGSTPALPIGARVLIDCDGGAVPCEVIDRDELRGMVRMRMVLPGQKRDGLTFWRPDPSPPSALPIRLGGDGDSPSSGNGSADEAAGWASPPDLVCATGSRAGVAVVGHPSGRALLALSAALGWLALARDARRLEQARAAVRTYRAGECPL